ncbi:hypothetical protein K502DRAFT_364130 [Neoconidiobolus thromboides FSU 785]|nr:hypothetical protein K502DRAFT_364130 [Neoconidiobolus thromboides FSU 785]
MFSNHLEGNLASSIIFVIAGVSTILNLLVTIVAFKLDPTANVDIIITLLISLVDLVISLFYFISQIAIWISDNPLLTDGSVLCWFNSVISEFFSSNTVTFLSILALIRYLSVVKKIKISYLIIILSTVAIFLFNLGMLIGDFAISIPKVMLNDNYCRPRRVVEGKMAKIFIDVYNSVLLAKYAIFIMVTYFSYIGIVLFRYKTTLNSLYRRSIDSDVLQKHFNNSVKKKVYIFFFKAILLLIGYTLAVIPDLISLILYVAFNLKLTPALDLVCTVLRSLIPLLNPLFVLMLQEGVYYTLKGLFLNKS